MLLIDLTQAGFVTIFLNPCISKTFSKQSLFNISIFISPDTIILHCSGKHLSKRFTILRMEIAFFFGLRCYIDTQHDLFLFTQSNLNS